MRLFFFILTIFYLPFLAFAQSAPACVAPKFDTATPPASNGPVEVRIGFFFTDITGISDPDQNIQADIAQVMQWRDERLVGLEGCNIAVPDIWTPRLELVNSSRLTPKYTQARNQVQILKNGQVRYVQRYSGWISTYHNLSKFPFDKQVFTFELLSPFHDVKSVKLLPDTQHIGLASKFNVEDWSFGAISSSVEDKVVASFQSERSVMTIKLEARRHVLYYVYKVLVPLALIVSMSWVVFWIKPSNFEAQIGFGATSMLTMIAFQFSLTNSLPKLNYFTSMDYLVFGGTLFVYAAILEALITGVLFRKGKETQAQKLDLFCRVAFPLGFLLYWLSVMFRSFI